MTNRLITTMRSALALSACLLLLSAARVQPATAQDACADADDNQKNIHYSLYWEDFKTGNFTSALPNLRWMLECAPAHPGGTEKNFQRAIVLYDSLAARAESADDKVAYLDTAVVLHDQAMSTLKDAGVEIDPFTWKLEKGRFLQQHAEQLPDRQGDVVALYEELYGMDPTRLNTYYITVLIADKAQKDKETAVTFMEEVEEQFPEDADLASYIDQVRNALFKTPEERMEFLEGRLEKNPGDLDLVNELFDIYQDLGMRQKMYAIGEQLMSMEPTASTYRILAKLRLDDGEYQEAFDLYEKAIGLGTATATDYYNMGVAQQNLDKLSSARTYYRKALEVDSNFGRAYLAIGDLYAIAVSNCGAAMEREDKAVYWLVVDYYNKAKAADASVSNAATQKARTYQRVFPSAEDLFFKNWKSGQSYRVDYGCYAWINESTTVKAP